MKKIILLLIGFTSFAVAFSQPHNNDGYGNNGYDRSHNGTDNYEQPRDYSQQGHDIYQPNQHDKYGYDKRQTYGSSNSDYQRSYGYRSDRSNEYNRRQDIDRINRECNE